MAMLVAHALLVLEKSSVQGRNNSFPVEWLTTKVRVEVVHGGLVEYQVS